MIEGWHACWPTALERRRLWWLWVRQRRQPQRPRGLPAAWRRSGRLLFWYTLLRLWQQEPVVLTAAVLSVPVWLLHWGVRLAQGFWLSG